jgi:branched-chain amino acid transport system permease protein
MADFLQNCFAGIAVGCIYALVALGFAIIYRASEVINFAQGELLLVGAYLVFTGVFFWHLNFFLALILGIVGTILIGILFERFVLRRMIGRPVFSILMITIGLDTILSSGVTVIWGGNLRSAVVPYDLGSSFKVGGVTFGINQIWTIIITVVLCAVLYFFFKYTKYGLAMRATAIDQEAAIAIGIKVRVVYALAWGIAGAIATIGGVFLAANRFDFDPTLGSIALFAFPAIILGGLDSIPGAVIGGILIGLTQNLTALYDQQLTPYLGQSFDEIAPYVLMIIILFIRPYGLFGTRKVERI